ncbi:MAG TPA: PA14 domain-containing protein [Candidatus Limnocylindria bacterium]|nr:PA14 domain-containing protein [Candidatus Limnocylindria bacterium]
MAVSLTLLFVRAQAATHFVAVEDSFFDPFQLAIDVGDTVVWNGNGGQDHTVTSDDGLFDAVMAFGEVFSYMFTDEATYPYYCANHGGPGGAGMSGFIVVSASTVNNPPDKPLNFSPANGASNQPLTVQLRANAFSDSDPQDFHGASQWLVRQVPGNVIVFNSGEDTANKTNRTLPNGALGYGTNYTWQVRYKDGRGQWSDYSVASTFTTLVPVTETGIGLKASYNNSTNFAAPLAITTNATVHFDWGHARPHRRITADDFAVRWEGSLLPQFTERYDVQFQFRGRARVWVNNELLIDEWAGCSFPQTRRGRINLIGGQLALLRIEYIADAAGAMATLRWTSPSVPIEVVPSTRLFPRAP